MSRGRRSLVAIALVAVLGVASTTPAPGSGRAAPPAGEIVFVSDRATANPGEIYALAPGRAARDVSRSPYADVALAASPVGRAYAYWSDRTGPWRLLVSPRGGAPRGIVIGGRAGSDPQYPSFAPIFSADGTRLLIPYVPAGSASFHLRFALANVAAGPARPVALPCLQSPVWSADGALVACVGRAAQQVSVFDLSGHVRFRVPGIAAFWSAGGRLAVAGIKSTVVTSAAGTLIARLNGVAQAWSPDGRLLALTRPGSLLLVDPGRSGTQRVLYRHGDGSLYGVSFTPDGREIAFSGSRLEPVVEAVAGGAVHTLPAGFYGMWSRDGRYAFATADNTTITIRVGDRYGRGARVVGHLAFNDHELSGLAWLGDGSGLLYNGSVHNHADLWTMGTDGGAQRRLTNTGELISAPAWSADGTQLAYGSSALKGGLCGYCGGSIAVAGPDGHKRALVPGTSAGQESEDTNASWSPSGTQLAVSNAFNGGVWVVGLDGSGRVQIAPDGAGPPAWSPDAATVAYTSDFSGGQIWGVDPTGANRRRLLPASRLKAVSLAWSPDGRQLAFSTADGIYVGAADGSAPPVRVAAATAPSRLSFSPDGQWLAFAAQTGTVHPYSAIYTVGVDGSRLRQLTTGPFDSADPAWRPVL